MMRLIFFFLFLSTSLFAVTPKSLSSNTAENYFNVGPTQYVVDNAGNTIAVWSVFNGQNTVLQYAYKPVGGDWQTPGDPRAATNVISPFYYSVIDWTIAMDLAGNCVVVWRVFNGTHTVVQANYRPFGGTFSAMGAPINQQNILNHYLYNISTLPQVGIGAGYVTILWTVFNGYNNVIQASLKSPTTSFSQPGIPTNANNILNYLSFRKGYFNISSTPLLYVDLEGNAIVAWTIYNGLVLTIQAVTRNADDVFEIAGNPQSQDNIISPRIYNINTLEGVFMGSGNAVVYWKRTDQVTYNLILQAAYKLKNGVWQKPELD